jgi:hypothetical protein
MFADTSFRKNDIFSMSHVKRQILILQHDYSQDMFCLFYIVNINYSFFSKTCYLNIKCLDVQGKNSKKLIFEILFMQIL